MTIGKVNIEEADKKTRQIYDESLRVDPKWQSLDLSEKLRLVSLIKEVILELQKAGDVERLNALTGAMVVDHINARGPSRLHKFDMWVSSVRERRMAVDLKNPENREALLNEYRAIFKSIDLKYSDEDKED